MLPTPVSPETTQQNTPQIVPLRFWVDHEPEDQKGNYKAVEWIEWAKKGSNGATVTDKVARVRKHNPAVWSVCEAYYDAWAKGQEEPTEGTPLAAWPGVTRGQVDQLKLINLRSVEDLADANESTLERIGMGARALRDTAIAFVKAKQGQAALAGELVSRDAQIATLTQQVADLTETVGKLAKGKPRRDKPKDAAGG